MSGFAWVTLATNDSYSLGALVLAHSLKRVNTAHQLAIMITPGVSEAMKTQLSAVYNVVKVVDVLDSKDEENLSLLARPELGITFTKLHCWKFTQFDKCVFLDADTILLQNSDELFERDELSAAPDIGWPDCFNSGVFVFKPSDKTFKELIDFALVHGTFDGGDQGLLNLFFSDWATKDISKHLPFVYNVVSSVTYTYLPAFKQFQDRLKIIHFLGSSKPWLQPFDTETGVARVTGDAQTQSVFIQLWWDLFCTYVHPTLSSNMAGLAGALSSVKLGEPRSKEETALQEHLRRQGWEEGNIDYMGKDSFDNIWKKISETLASGSSSPPPAEPISSAPVPSEPIALAPAPSEPVAQVPALSEPAAPVPAPSEPVAQVPAAPVPAPSEPVAQVPAPSEPAAPVPAPSEPVASAPSEPVAATLPTEPSAPSSPPSQPAPLTPQIDASIPPTVTEKLIEPLKVPADTITEQEIPQVKPPETKSELQPTQQVTEVTKPAEPSVPAPQQITPSVTEPVIIPEIKPTPEAQIPQTTESVTQTTQVSETVTTTPSVPDAPQAPAETPVEAAPVPEAKSEAVPASQQTTETSSPVSVAEKPTVTPSEETTQSPLTLPPSPEKPARSHPPTPPTPTTPTVTTPTPPTSPPAVPQEPPTKGDQLKVEPETIPTPPITGSTPPTLPGTAAGDEPPIPPKRKGGKGGGATAPAAPTPSEQPAKQQQKGGKGGKGKK